MEGRLEKHIQHHEQMWQRAKGFAAAFGVLLTVAQFLLEAWLRK